MVSGSEVLSEHQPLSFLSRGRVQATTGEDWWRRMEHWVGTVRDRWNPQSGGLEIQS
jgi:hypothetical protein